MHEQFRDGMNGGNAPTYEQNVENIRANHVTDDN
jgi:hypothetical protein